MVYSRDDIRTEDCLRISACGTACRVAGGKVKQRSGDGSSAQVNRKPELARSCYVARFATDHARCICQQHFANVSVRVFHAYILRHYRAAGQSPAVGEFAF
jgi:hypothetical protein